MALKEYAKAGMQQAKSMIKKWILTGLKIVAPYILIAVVLALIVSTVVIFVQAEEESAIQDGMASASGSSWEQFKRYVLTKEGGGKDATGTYYVVENDGAGNPTVGHGLCLYSIKDAMYLHDEAFNAHGIDSKNLANRWLKGERNLTVSIEIADNIWEDNLKYIFNGLSTEFSSLGLTEYQLYALTDVKYQRRKYRWISIRFYKLLAIN